jgi:microcompartment protein CcmK/EutM
MLLGTVVGQVVSTVKVETLRSIKLMVVQLQDEDGRPQGRPVVAADGVGYAGPGDHVFLAQKKEAAIPFKPIAELVPVDLSIVGFVDEVRGE